MNNYIPGIYIIYIYMNIYIYLGREVYLLIIVLLHVPRRGCTAVEKGLQVSDTRGACCHACPPAALRASSVPALTKFSKPLGHSSYVTRPQPGKVGFLFHIFSSESELARFERSRQCSARTARAYVAFFLTTGPETCG